MVNGIANWDCPEAIDLIAFKECLNSAKSYSVDQSFVGDNRPVLDDNQISLKRNEILLLIDEIIPYKERIIIVDGFLLFSDSALREMFDLEFFLYSPKNILRNRRLARTTYITAEGQWVDPPNYFDEVVYPAYEKYNYSVLQGNVNVIQIDSHENSIEDVIIIALREIIAYLQRKVA